MTGLTLSPAKNLEVAVSLLAAIGRPATQGGTVSQDQLAEAVPLLALDPAIDALRNANYIAETKDEDLSLVRDLHSVSLAELARDLGLALGKSQGSVERPALRQVAKASGLLPGLLVKLQEAEDEILGASVAQAIEEHISKKEQQEG